MTDFASRWLDFDPKTGKQATSKTCKRSSKALQTGGSATSRTSKRAFAGFAGTSLAHSGKREWRQLTPDEQRAEVAKFNKRGWLAIYSAHLGEVIILARDEQAAADAPAGHVTYTGDEIAHLRGAAPDELQQVHGAKTFFGGRITGRKEATA